MNTLSYIIYISLTYFITVHVGLIFYRNGKIFILNLLHGEERLTNFINRVLLVGYYLLNLGYVALTIQSFQTIETFTEMLTTVCTSTGKIMLLLGAIHFCNMAAIYLISRQHHATNKMIDI